MGKIWVEICLISARGLRHSSSLWKLQWFAVGWIDPNNKYCTKLDASGNANPVWKTKFATLIDDSNFQDMALNVQVYSREPIFLRERLQGTATIVLKEFLAKYSKISETSSSVTEEVGSYQLRKTNSTKSQGFVDVSIRISQDKDEPISYPGGEGGFVLMSNSNNITLSTEAVSEGGFPSELPLIRRQRLQNQGTEGGAGQANPSQLPIVRRHRPENQSQPNYPYTHPTGYTNPSVPGTSYPLAIEPIHRPPRTPPPPSPPSNVGYIPTFLPRTDLLSDSYMNMPSSSSAAAPRQGPRPGLAMGATAGALAAGAVIFGDDFMSGFDVPSGLHDPSLIISTDPPF